jgi:hypothetical protein
MKKYAYIRDNNDNINIWRIVGSDIIDGVYYVESRNTRRVISKKYFEIRSNSKLLWVEGVKLNIDDSKFDIEPYGLDINMVEYVKQSVKTGNRLIDELELDWYHL